MVLILQITRLVKQGGLFDNCSLVCRSGFTRISKILEVDKRGYFYIFIISIFVIFILLFYQSFQQFQLWSEHEISKFLLPPYQSLDYFIFYSFFRFFVSYLVSLLAALIFLFIAKFLNKKYQERFFETKEIYFGALAIFLVSYPGWLFYLTILITFYLLFSILCFLFLKRQRRISMYYWWIPMAIFVIIIIGWLQDLAMWQILEL